MQITYVVQEADTLKSISQKFCANLEDLSSQNGISSSSTIFPNTTILVPVSEKPILAPPPPSVPSSSLGTNNGSHGLSRLRGIVIGGSLGGAVVLLALALWVIWVVRNRALLHKSGNKITEEPNSPSNLKTTEELNSPSNLKAESLAVKTSQQEKLLASVISSIDKPCNYSIESLEKATQNFSPLCHIQGSVYKGTINGKNYAIKQMKGDISQELKILQKVNHSNLVKLEGFCIGSEGKSYLVYEYADNGTLNAWLHDPESIQNKIATSDLSSWKTRLQIALDVADGLQYIHEHTTPTVVHKDVNSRNILLDSKFRAKIANFAMAKSGINVCTRHIEGTPGYMAPEYLANGVVTPKLDVFAFGVVLLELISGKKAIVHEWGVPLGGNADLLWTQIKPLMEGEDREVKLRKWVDPDLHGVYPNDTVLCLADIAKACVDKDPGARPSLSEIVYRLSNALEAHLDKFDEIFENPNHDISR
ncbi:hypothetical protein SUGI_0239040 [Cryptomeria japonica]|nr:hypothetical protein SUGI_0239040 [Cryptomeria japonica]